MEVLCWVFHLRAEVRVKREDACQVLSAWQAANDNSTGVTRLHPERSVSLTFTGSDS